MDGSRWRTRSTSTLFLSAFICAICGPSSAAAGQYVYVEVFCNNPYEVRADEPRPDKNAPKLLSDPPKPPLVCRYFSNIVFAGRFRSRDLPNTGGPAPQEQAQEAAAITKAASESFDLHVRKPCKYKQVKIGGVGESREEVEKSRNMWLQSYGRGADGCADTFEFMY